VEESYLATQAARIHASKFAHQRAVRHSFKLFALAFILSMPLWGESMGYSLPSFIVFLLATSVQFMAGWTLYLTVYRTFKQKFFNQDALMLVSATAAYGLSVAAYLGYLPAQFLYFKISATLIALTLLKNWLIAFIKEQKKMAAEQIVHLLPATVFIERNGQIEEVLADSIRVGDTFIVPPKGRLIADGIVIDGKSIIDQAILASEEVLKEKNSHVFAGTLNQTGPLKIKAIKVGKDTTLATIIAQFDAAQKMRIYPDFLEERALNTVGQVVFCLAFFTWLGWGILAGSFYTGMLHALTLLMMGFPPLLGFISILPLLMAKKLGSQNDLLFKDVFVLTQISRMKTVWFEKLGALTCGAATVQHIHAMSSYRTAEILNIGASLAIQSPHPLAHAVVKKAQASHISFEPAKDFERSAGKVIFGNVKDQRYYLASLPFAKEMGVTIEKDLGATLVMEQQLLTLERKGKTIIVLGKEQLALAYFIIVDALRENGVRLISELKERGIHVGMLTKDPKDLSLDIAWQVKIEDIKSELLPDDEAKQVHLMQQKNNVLGVVGNSVHDASAMASAEVNFAINDTLQVADVTLLHNNLMGIVDAVDLAQAVKRKSQQNLFWALLCNGLAIPLAAFGLLTPSIAWATLWTGIIVIIANTLLMRYWQKNQ
jgi:Cu+-exporting ATPase